MIFSVSQVIKSLRRMLTQNPYIEHLKVRGEFFEANNSGNSVYFKLTEKNEAVNKNPFILNFLADKSIFKGIPIEEYKGKQVVVEGNITIFNSSSIHIKAESIKFEDGEGEFQRRLKELDEECKRLGYYDKPKKTKPKFCFNIGVVTSQTGAAIGDISKSLQENKYVNLYIYHTKVQGSGADIDIANNIRKLDSMGLDAIIVGRGGGSQADLITFNSKVVIEAIFNAKTLIASAVGHQRDTFIIDRVSDLCYITPTAAAKELIGKKEDIDNFINEIKTQLNNEINKKYSDIKNRLTIYNQNLEINSPINKLRDKKVILKELQNNIDKSIETKINSYKDRFNILNQSLINLYPIKKLENYKRFIDNAKFAIESLIVKKFEIAEKELDLLKLELEKNSPIGKIESGTMIATVNGKIITDTRKLNIGDIITLYSKQEEMEVKIVRKKLNSVIMREHE